MKTPDQPEPLPAPQEIHLEEGARSTAQGIVEHGAGSAIQPAADALAWSLLGLLAFLAVCFVAVILALRRRERLHPMDVNGDGERPVIQPRRHGQPPEDSPRQPWEREADWWKK